MTNSKGQTALMYAAAVGNMDLVLPLLRAGANRDRADAKGRKAQDWGASRGNDWPGWVIMTDPRKISVVDAALSINPKTLQALVAQGCKVTERAIGQTSLIAAAKSCHIEVLDVILEQAAKETNEMQGNLFEFLEAEDDNSETALVASSRLGHVPVVLRLLKAGAKRDQRAVDAAAAAGQVLCGVMVASDPAARSLHDACYRGQLIVLKSLLVQGSEPDAHDPRVGRNASTPLMACAAGRANTRTRDACMSCARHLIEALPEAALSAKNSQGVTALMVAAGNADLSLAKLLIKKG